MAKKKTKKTLKEEIKQLRERLHEIENNVEDELQEMAGQTVKQVREFVGPQPVSPELRERLIREIAYMKSSRAQASDPAAQWLAAEQEVDHILRNLDLLP